jgi:ABC-type nitrate/sulfonate/bicarbonate transport system substrate-binding protein
MSETPTGPVPRPGFFFTVGRWVKKGYILAVLLVLAALILVALMARARGCRGAPPATAAPLKCRIAVPLQMPSALLLIARERDLFRSEGLDVEFHDYVSGKRALAAMLEGKADLSATADVPIAFAAFRRTDFAILATIAVNDSEPRIVARTDRGIRKPADLAGKRIATQKASAVHFFLDLFLLEHRIAADAVQISYMRAEELPTALAEGRIDAFSMREPYVSQARELLGDRIVVFDQPGLYRRTDDLVAMSAFLDENPGVPFRLLRALLEAETWARANPGEAIELVARVLDAPAENIARLWPQLDLSVRFDQALLTSLDDQARWIIRNQYVPARTAPDFLPVARFRYLAELRPDRVSVIH